MWSCAGFSYLVFHELLQFWYRSVPLWLHPASQGDGFTSMVCVPWGADVLTYGTGSTWFWDPFLLAVSKTTVIRAKNHFLLRDNRLFPAYNLFTWHSLLKWCRKRIRCFRVVGCLELILFNRTALFFFPARGSQSWVQLCGSGEERKNWKW